MTTSDVKLNASDTLSHILDEIALKSHSRTPFSMSREGNLRDSTTHYHGRHFASKILCHQGGGKPKILCISQTVTPE